MFENKKHICPVFPDMLCPQGEEMSKACMVRINGDFDPMGDFHEALNWATRDKLPVIFLVQNNKYAISVPVENQLAGSSIYKIGAGYEGLNRFKVDGTDFFKSYEVAQKAVDLARAGQGPSLVEADTIRLLPHSSSDSQIKYRSQKELEEDRKNDPIPKFETYLIREKIKSEKEIEILKNQIKQEIDQVI